MSRDDDLAVDPLAATRAPDQTPGDPALDMTQTAGEAPGDPALDMTQTAGEAPGRRARAPETSLVGEALAHFRIERLLGKGGMGEVYLATDTSLDRPVAIKRLPGDVAQHPGLRERFFREARAQARIKHAHICHIYFVGEERGQLFFAMEYVDGQSVQERLEREGPLPVGEALELCRMAALGLREANEHGFTHRDIKPSNLMLDRRGQVKIVDFGLVKQTGAALAPAGGTDESTGTSSTAQTAMVGTPLYMAPEQADGQVVDFRADIYALGATLHQLVSGTPPFAGDSLEELVGQHQNEKRPAVRSKDKSASLVDRLCDRMMAKRPEDRFESYDELIAAIDRISPTRARAAGLWVRTFALGVDFLCALFLALPLMLITGLDNMLFSPVLAAYFIGCHGRFGQTVGKWLFELELTPAARSGSIGYGQATVRFAVQWGPLLLALALEELVIWSDSEGLSVRVVAVGLIVLGMVYGLVAAFVVGMGSPDKRTFWDRVARTQVRYRTAA